MKRIKTLVLFSEIVATLLGSAHASDSALTSTGGQDRNVDTGGRGPVESDVSEK